MMNMFHIEYKSFFSVSLINIIIKYVKSEQNGVSPNSLFVLPNSKTKDSFMVLTSLKGLLHFLAHGSIFHRCPVIKILFPRCL